MDLFLLHLRKRQLYSQEFRSNLHCRDSVKLFFCSYFFSHHKCLRTTSWLYLIDQTKGVALLQPPVLTFKLLIWFIFNVTKTNKKQNKYSTDLTFHVQKGVGRGNILDTNPSIINESPSPQLNHYVHPFYTSSTTLHNQDCEKEKKTNSTVSLKAAMIHRLWSGLSNFSKKKMIWFHLLKCEYFLVSLRL